jgi:histidine ammonia-lyase
VRIGHDHIRELQRNLLRSHACGVGDPLPEAVVRSMMLLRANSLAKGFSGVRPIVVERLCDLLNRRVHPVIPAQGSVGASGDLAPLAHLALVLVGEGKASMDGEAVPGGEALRRAGLAALELEAKEGLSLLNGTQAMLAVGVLALLEAECLADSADVIGALSLESLRGTWVAFDPRLQAVRGHAGQIESARRLRQFLEDSEIRQSHLHCGRVQDAYSLRCMPQVHGAVRDTLAFARRTFEVEINAAVDNPLVFTELGAEDGGEAGEILSGGNFHGQPLAFALDYLAIALTSLGGIAERRIERLVNPSLNEGLPPFLAAQPGLHSGLMMAQVTAAALVAENRTLAHPASVDSITTSGNKEDYVSMGMGAALKLQRVLRNTTTVLAIETVAARQALHLLDPLQPGRRLIPILHQIARRIPPIREDRIYTGDFAEAEKLIRSGVLRGE